MSEPPEEPESEGIRRLDPDQAIAERQVAQEPKIRPGAPVIDTRRYQYMIGGFGLVLVIAFSVYLWAHGGAGTIGIPAGQPLHRFVAPLASSNLDVPANVHPRCNPARPARRGLNVCGRTPLVLGLFALGDSQCVQEIDAMQRIAPSFPGVQFAAVAVNATRRATERLARSHHWSIPIAYDESGAVGTVYGMEVCPIIELARPGGTVAQRLIGDYWTHPAKLAAAVRRIAPR